MKKARIIACATASAFLFALGLPNEVFLYGFPVLGFIALAPLYLAMLETPSYGFAALVAGLYGAVHHGLSSYWLYFFHGFAFWTLGSTVLAYFVIYAVWGLYLAFFLKKSGTWRPLAFAVFWVVLEYAKSVGFLGYPWGLLAYTQTEVLPLLQIADSTGVYGISFFLALVNASLAETLFRGRTRTLLPALTPLGHRGRRGRRVHLEGPAALPLAHAALALGGALLCVAVVAGYGFWRLGHLPAREGSLDAVLVQQNVDPWEEDESTGIRKNMDLAREALDASAKTPDLIVFSESSLSRPYEQSPDWYRRNPKGDPFLTFVRESGTYLFTGSPIVLSWERGEATNSVILISPEGKQLDDYAKIHPVPFAEAIPFWEWKPFREFIQNVVGLQSGWVMGTRYTLFELPVGDKTVRFGAPICFEDAFPDVCRRFYLDGADLLLNLTNDSWSKTDSSEVQHFAAARFRAIEFRKSLVRSTNGGLTCVVDASGAVQDSLPLFTAASLRVSVPLYADSEPSLYLRYGDWFAYASILVFAAIFLILWVGERPGRRKGQ